MHILIIGAAGMIGRKLTSALIKKGELRGRPITELTLVDVIEPAKVDFSGLVNTAVADLSVEERREAVLALGHPAFRASQLSRHYFERLTLDPEAMTDLPKAIRPELVAALLPPLLTPVRTLRA